MKTPIEISPALGRRTPSSRNAPTATQRNRSSALLFALVSLLALAAFFSLPHAACAAATTVFSDDFEAAFAGWDTVGSPDWYKKTPKNGTHSIRLNRTESIAQTISTEGYQSIATSFYLGAAGLESADAVRTLWYDGSQWTTLKQIINGDPEEDGQLHYFQYQLPASANENAAFRLRFEITGDANRDYAYVDDVVVTGEPVLRTLSLTGAGNGSVKVNGTPQSLPWSGQFPHQTSVTLEAVPGAEYEFSGWSGDLTGSANPTAIILDGDKDITAGFSLVQYTLSLTKTGSGSATVDGVSQSLPWSGQFDSGTQVVLVAIPAVGWEFSGWSGDVIWPNCPLTITMSGDKNITANFTEMPTLNLTKTGSGSVRVDGTLHSLPWSGQFATGANVELQAVPDAGWEFSGWSGDLTWPTSPLTVTMSSNKAVTANFTEMPTLSLTKTGSGSVRVDGTLRSLPWSGQFATGSSVQLQAVPDAGWEFDDWSGDISTGTNPFTIIIDGDKDITANFTEMPTLSLTKTGSGSVRVDGTLQSLPWSAQFTTGASVQLQAVPDDGWEFDSWSGDVSSTNATITVTINADTDITAVFAELPTYTLTLDKTGNGSVEVDGTLHALPWSGEFLVDAEVTLTAVPDTGWEFESWSGDVSFTSATITIQLTADTDITANYGQVPTKTLSITGAGNGAVRVNGTLQSLPWSGLFNADADVTLEAVPDTHDEFVSWSGDLSGDQNPTTITMDADKSMTATFGLVQYSLTVRTRGNGSIAVDGVPCTLPWTRQFAPGAQVTLEAFPGEEAQFVAWSGDLEDITNPITITIDSDKTISAKFSESGLFPDVPDNYWAYDEIEACLEAGIIGGYPDGYYRPQGKVDRSAMAVFISRALAGGPENVPEGPETPSFADVATDHWTYKYVEYAVANNIVAGYQDGNYHPDWLVTRGQTAVFIARALAEPTGEDGLAAYEPPETPTFPDVPTDFWCYRHVEYIAERNIASGYPDGLYYSARQVTRDQMAVFMARAFDLLD